MERVEEVTHEKWELCNKYNRDLLDEFLMNSPHLSLKSIKSYRSNLRVWFNWVRENLNNIPQYEIKSRDYMKYQNWLLSKDHSSSDITNKRSAISTLNNYIVLYYSDVYPMFHNFIVRGMSKPDKKFVREKIPPTKSEMELLYKILEEQQEWQKIAYLKFTFATGCRREESRQLRKEIIDYKPIAKLKEIEDENGDKVQIEVKYYQTHIIRCKGKGKVGKERKLKYDQDAMDAIQRWLDVRGEDDCPYVFVTKYGGKIKQVGETTLNNWCKNDFAEIIGRRFFPHIIRAGKATISVVEDGKSLESVQNLLGHSSSETTKIYVVRDEEEDVDELFMD